MKLSTQQKLETLVAWEFSIWKLEQEEKKLAEALQPSFESPFYRAIFAMEESYTNAVSLMIGDEGDWLNWYRFDNKMGKGGMKAGFGNRLKLINSLDALLKLIEAKPASKKKKTTKPRRR